MRFIRFDEVKDTQIYHIENRGSYLDCDNYWEDIMQFARDREILNADTEFFWLLYDKPSIVKLDEIRYSVCVSSKEDLALEGAIKKTEIKAGKYAVFGHTGLHNEVLSTYKMIFEKWLPSSGCELRDLPIFEKYLEKRNEDPKLSHYKIEIFLPIK